MRYVIAFGTSGCGKGEFLESCSTSGVVHTYELEHEWEELSGQSWGVLLEKPTEERRKALEKALAHVQGKLRKAKPKAKTVVLGVHATNMVETMLTSPVPVRALRKLKPEFCVTVHDDIYAVHKRLSDVGFSLNFQQLLLWRGAELLVADLVANDIVGTKDLAMPNVWLGVKHPKSNVKRLLSHAAAPRVYSAYSITGLLTIKDQNHKAALVAETNQYRASLYERQLVVFDPATLDDRILINPVMKDTGPKKGTLTIQEKSRWPYTLNANPADAPAVADPAGTFPLTIAHAEAFMLRGPAGLPHNPYDDVDAHITQIDLRYVAQADFVTVWRPFSQGIASAGCFREASTAFGDGKNVIAYNPKEDQKQYKDNPANNTRPLKAVWPSGVPLIPSEEEFWKRVDKEVTKLRKRQSRRR